MWFNEGSSFRFPSVLEEPSLSAEKTEVQIALLSPPAARVRRDGIIHREPWAASLSRAQCPRTEYVHIITQIRNT